LCKPPRVYRSYPSAYRRKIDHVDQLGSLYLGGFHCRHGLLDVLEFEPRTTTPPNEPTERDTD
ncbi:MAG: hypothetical protein WBC86_11785, partial [Pseudolabrys sp.]